MGRNRMKWEGMEWHEGDEIIDTKVWEGVGGNRRELEGVVYWYLSLRSEKE